MQSYFHFIIYNFRFYLICICFLLFNTNNSFAQSEAELKIQQLISEIYESTESTYDYSEIYDKLSFLYANPINLNTATEEELKELFFLTDIQIQAILEYRKRYKGFYTLYELAAIELLDLQTIQSLLYFTKIEKIDSKKRDISYFLPLYGNRLQIRTERVFNYNKGILQDTHYLGSPYKLYLRYYHQPSSALSYGITMEKDAGEEFFKGTQAKGFDFYSVHFFYKPTKGIVKTIAIGDYYAEFGQGLTFSNSFSMGKSIYFEQLYKAKNNISPYRSVNENGFLKGAAVKIGKNNFASTLFFSNKKIDAGISVKDTFDIIDEYYAESIDESGYHRTPNEFAKKNNLNETLFGINLRYQMKKTTLGGTLIHGFYDKEIIAVEKLYSLYRFSGKSFTNAGIDYVFTLNKILFFGEAATNGQTASFVSGLLFPLSSKFKLTTIYRYYPKNYTAPYSNAFRENSLTENEKGLFTGIRWNINRKWDVSAYYDIVVFPWLKYLINMPSAGNEFLLHATNRQSFKWTNQFRFRYKLNEKNYSNNESPLPQILFGEKYNLRYELVLQPNYSLKFSTKIEYCKTTQSTENASGFLTQQDISYFINNTSLTFRYALFTVSDYDARIYVYEPDVPGTFNSFMFHNSGYRVFLLVKTNILDKITAYLKLGRTYYFSNTSIPVQETDNLNYKNEIRMMIDFKF